MLERISIKIPGIFSLRTYQDPEKIKVDNILAF